MKLEIWFEFASTYSYLTVCRAEPLLQRAQIAYEWRPFLLGPIFADRGMDTSPFVTDPVKGAYMWRDMARRARNYGLPFTRPDIFPMNGLRAARVMTAALGEPWCGVFAKAVFAAQFEHGADISDEAVLQGALRACGVPPKDWLERAHEDTTKAELLALTDQARALGLFGAPSFVVGNEVFWGDDRLEDAINWAVTADEGIRPVSPL
ncbi:2-hydroxychromene-2-carboxylate isomerase [Tateyamaria pelophila]|uniref:2-hydroxychromene-2-carboxylate isomerase n=1 Tax=Tateyamaria pelophila TaxID=328415 RepID=UPI001CC11EEE|nr:2-hydroxychromene-2-carboxylate isomerase [Tateyamaria pelophila]